MCVYIYIYIYMCVCLYIYIYTQNIKNQIIINLKFIMYCKNEVCYTLIYYTLIKDDYFSHFIRSNRSTSTA